MSACFSRMSLLVLFVLCLAACDDIHADNSDKEEIGLADYLCAVAPVSCSSDLYKRVYLAPPEEIYEITLNGRRLVVPMGYIDTTQLVSDSRYPIKTSLFLEMLLPKFSPHSTHNIREFFTPYERSAMKVHVSVPNSQAISWTERLSFSRLGATRPSSPVRRPNKYGLEGWGEDFDKWPKRRPCTNLGHNESPCGEPTTPDDVWRPIKPNGPPSVMICEPDTLDDVDDRVITMPVSEREAYFANPKNWSGRRRAFCRHEMLYQPINAWVEIRYPRRFITQWKEIEDGIRQLLDSFIAKGTSSTR